MQASFFSAALGITAVSPRKASSDLLLPQHAAMNWAMIRLLWLLTMWQRMYTRHDNAKLRSTPVACFWVALRKTSGVFAVSAHPVRAQRRLGVFVVPASLVRTQRWHADSTVKSVMWGTATVASCRSNTQGLKYTLYLLARSSWVRAVSGKGVLSCCGTYGLNARRNTHSCRNCPDSFSVLGKTA